MPNHPGNATKYQTQHSEFLMRISLFERRCAKRGLCFSTMKYLCLNKNNVYSETLLINGLWFK